MITNGTDGSRGTLYILVASTKETDTAGTRSGGVTFGENVMTSGVLVSGNIG